MKKIIFVILFVISIMAYMPALADTVPYDEAPLLDKTAQQSGYSAFDSNEYALSFRIGQIIKIVLGLVGTIFFVLTIYAGFLWMTAGGQEEQVTKAKDIIKRSVMGLIIVLAAYSITFFVMDRLL